MPKKSSTTSRSTLAKLAFYTFILAALAYLAQAILAKLNFSSNIIHALQNIVYILLFVITGALGWKYCRTKTLLIRIIYIVCIVIIVVAVILPII